MKNPFKNIILDAPFQEEITRPVPVKEEPTPVKKDSEIIWKGKPVNRNLFFGKRETPLSESEMGFRFVFSIGIIVIFLTCYFSVIHRPKFLIINLYWIVASFFFKLLFCIVSNKERYAISQSHVIFKNSIWRSKREILLCEIKRTSYSKGRSPNYGDVNILLKNKEILKFRDLKKAYEIRTLLDQTIQKKNPKRSPAEIEHR